MTEWIELTGAIAALLEALQWPLLALVIGLLFRSEIQLLLRRAKSWKVFGLEGEFSDLVEELAGSTAASEGSTPTLQHPAQNGPTDEPQEEADEERETETIIRLAAISPRAALMQLAADIEEALIDKAQRFMMANEQLDDISASRINMRDAARFLVSSGVLPLSVSENIARFREIRNRVVHGGEGSEEEILSAIDSGLSILRQIASIEVPADRPDPDEARRQSTAARAG